MHARLAWPGSGRPSASGSRRPAPGQPWPLVQRPFCSSWPLSRSRCWCPATARRPTRSPAIRQERPERPPRCRRLRRGRARLRCLQHPRRRLTRPRRPRRRAPPRRRRIPPRLRPGPCHAAHPGTPSITAAEPETGVLRTHRAPATRPERRWAYRLPRMPDGIAGWPVASPPTRPGTTGATGMPGWQQNIGTAGGSITDQATAWCQISETAPEHPIWMFADPAGIKPTPMQNGGSACGYQTGFELLASLVRVQRTTSLFMFMHHRAWHEGPLCTRSVSCG